jgi:hypothetical protein
MSEEIATYENGLPVLADDTLIQIAKQAEARIDAVIKIKQMALKVTNASDWTDQQGKPYLQASGSEKIANLFNISWKIDEPTMEQEADGTITYVYKGEFSLAGRSIEVEGSRSSRDTFFKKYEYDSDGRKVGEKPLDRRDLKMAAMTNLLGNGITRLLGIRNLTWEDLKLFAGIDQTAVKGKVTYKKGGQEQQPMKAPQAKTDKPEAPADAQTVNFIPVDVTQKEGTTNNKKWTKYFIKGPDGEYTTFDKKFADAAYAAKENGDLIAVTYTATKYGNDVVSVGEADYSQG